MHRIRWFPLGCLLAGGLICLPEAARCANARLVKVLPHYTDLKGRVALNPSLYERDAYQAYLRKHPTERGGMQFDIQWKSPGLRQVVVRLELRGNRGKLSTTNTLTQTVSHHGLFGSWSKVTMTGEAFQKFGELSAWRATLWDGETQLAVQESFLWAPK